MTAPEQLTKSREAFERWHNRFDQQERFKPTSSGLYKRSDTQAQWDAWQAAEDFARKQALDEAICEPPVGVAATKSPTTIKELAEAAGFDYEDRAYNLNKFAESIIDISVKFLSDNDCEFESEQLEEFWEHQ